MIKLRLRIIAEPHPQKMLPKDREARASMYDKGTFEDEVLPYKPSRPQTYTQQFDFELITISVSFGCFAVVQCAVVSW